MAIQDGRDCELWQFISSLSIPLIGSTYAKEMCKHEIDWHNIREDIEGNFDFTEWDGFGYEMNKSLHSFDYTEADELIDNVLYIKNSLFNQQIKETELTGKTFCITGKLVSFKNRDEAKQKIEAAGGKVVDSVSKKTDYLVNNDINSTSSKNQKAKSLNIPIITETQLLDML
jgi:DNA ligase (NAD+)